jgi:hypothetical protein
VALALGACTTLRMLDLPGRSPAYTQEDLHRELEDFSSRFRLVVSAAADQIATDTASPAVRKRALLWKLRFIPLAQEATLNPNPQEAYVSLLTLVVTMRHYLTEGQGWQTLGDQQPIAVDATRELEADLTRIGSRFLGDDEAARVTREVEDFVSRRPIAGQEFAVQSIRRTLAGVQATSAFQRVVSVPLSPFRALEGVGDSASAIREFTAVARDFVRTVEALPEQVRWQMELVLFEIEEREATRTLLASLDALTQSADRISHSTETLPEDVRALLEDSGGTLEQLDRTLASARDLAGPLRETSERIQQASASWASVLGPQDGGTAEPPGRPFDVREWESAVREIGVTSQHLERLLQEVRAASDARVAEAAVAPVAERADALTRAWIDLAAWRIAQLLLGGFALVLGYRFAVARLARR